MAEYETITLSPNETLQYDGGTLLENVIFDVSADDCALHINMQGDNWTMRHVAISGQIDTGSGNHGNVGGGFDTVITGDEAQGSGDEILIEDCYFGDGVVPGADCSLITSDADHAGHMIFRRCYVAGWNTAALYIAGSARVDSDGAGGTYRVADSYFHDNNIASVRIARDGSVVENCVFFHEGWAPWADFIGTPDGTTSIFGRAIWSSYGDTSQTVDVIDCEIRSDGTNLCPPDYGPVEECGAAAVKAANDDSNFHVQGGNVVGGIDSAYVQVDSDVGSDPDLTPPAGVPMDPAGAASEGTEGTVADGDGGSDPGDGNGDDDDEETYTYNTITLTGGSASDSVEYSFRFDGGDVLYGPNANTNPDDPLRDEITENDDGTYTVTGHLGGASDDFELSTDGHLIDDSIPDSVAVEEDGTSVEPYELYEEHTLTLSDSDDATNEYTLEFSGAGVDFGPNAETSDPEADTITDNGDGTWTINGYIANLDDDYYLYGQDNLDSITGPETITLAIDGEEVSREDATRDAIEVKAESYVEPITGDTHQRQSQWTVDGEQMGELVDEIRDWQTLTLTVRADKETVEEQLRPLERSAGKVETVPRGDGSYKGVDRSGGDAAVTLYPPMDHYDLRTKSSYLVSEYNETAIDQNFNAYEAEIEFVARDPKDGTVDIERQIDAGFGVEFGVDFGNGSAEWVFTFANGTIGTNRVYQEIQRGGETVDGVRNVSMNLERRQAIVLETSLNRQAATRIRSVPDGQDIARDESPGSRNTITVEAPSEEREDVLPTGEYIATGWETQWLNGDFYQVDLTLVETT